MRFNDDRLKKSHLYLSRFPNEKNKNLTKKTKLDKKSIKADVESKKQPQLHANERKDGPTNDVILGWRIEKL